MKVQPKIFLIAFLAILSNDVSFGQGLGDSQKSLKTPENFEHIDCGFQYPFPGSYDLSTSIGYSPYRELGQGKINRFSSSLVIYDIGCIDLDDPPRKMKKDEIISTLNSATKAYLRDSFEFIALPTAANSRAIYEFEAKTEPLRRRIKYILEGNRVLIFMFTTYGASGVEEALKLFNSVKYFSVREAAQKRMVTLTQKSLPQTPALQLTQTDAALNNLKGRVKSVRLEAEDVPVMVGKQERRIRTDETYDSSGKLLKSFWFQDSGYPTSARIYGFVNGARVSVSGANEDEEGFGLGSAQQSEIKLSPLDSRFDERYEYKYDGSKRLIERKEYNNRGTLSRIFTFIYKDDLMEERWFSPDGKLISTKRRQLDKNRNEIKYEFWWYEQTDKEIETYEYKKFDQFGNWTERRVVKTIIDRGLNRTRTSNEFRTITYYGK